METPPKHSPLKEKLVVRESISQDWGEDTRVNDLSDSENSDNSDNEGEEKDNQTMEKVKEERVKTPHTSPITRRLSMRAPSVHMFRMPEINELENADFLNNLAQEIALFPNPPTHTKPVEITPFTGPPVEQSPNPQRKATARWAMVAKFARKLTAQEPSSGDGPGKVKAKTRRGSKTIPNISEDQYV